MIIFLILTIMGCTLVWQTHLELTNFRYDRNQDIEASQREIN